MNEPRKNKSIFVSARKLQVNSDSLSVNTFSIVLELADFQKILCAVSIQMSTHYIEVRSKERKKNTNPR